MATFRFSIDGAGGRALLVNELAGRGITPSGVYGPPNFPKWGAWGEIHAASLRAAKARPWHAKGRFTRRG